MGDESNRDVFAGLERAGLLVTAMRFSADEVTTAAWLSQSTKGSRDRLDPFFELLSNDAKSSRRKQIGCLSCKIPNVVYMCTTRLAAVPC